MVNMTQKFRDELPSACPKCGDEPTIAAQGNRVVVCCPECNLMSKGGDQRAAIWQWNKQAGEMLAARRRSK